MIEICQLSVVVVVVNFSHGVLFSGTFGQISTKLGKKHRSVKGILESLFK